MADDTAGEELVRFEIEAGGIGVMTLNRPEALNALTVAMLQRIRDLLDQIASNPEVRVLILAAAGEKAFCVGADLKSRAAEYEAGTVHDPLGLLIRDVFGRMEGLNVPVIAAIQGYALGGGMEMALACDLRVAADTAKVGFPEAKVGSLPGAGGTQRLTRLAGPGYAKEMMFTGDHITAQDALAIGLVNRVVPKAQTLAAALELAAKIAAKSPLVLKLLKRTLREGAEMPLPQALAYEQAMIGLVLDSADAHEGCRAFIEKRKAEFKGC